MSSDEALNAKLREIAGELCRDVKVSEEEVARLSEAQLAKEIARRAREAGESRGKREVWSAIWETLLSGATARGVEDLAHRALCRHVETVRERVAASQKGPGGAGKRG